MCERFQHEEFPADGYFDFKGFRFKPPFHCMCCGKEICWKQWAFGRYCGPCDTGICQKPGKPLHPTPVFIYCGPNTELIDAVEAEKFNFCEERMRRVPPNEPVKWYERKPDLIFGKDLLDEPTND